MKRGAFTLVELLAATAMIGATICLIAPLCNAIFVEMPKAHRAFNAHSQMVTVLDAIARDIDSATGLPDNVGQIASTGNLMLIRTPEGDMAYRLEDGKVVRSQLDAAGREIGKPLIWQAPSAQVTWKLWRTAGQNVGIEVDTAIIVTIDGHKVSKFVNSRMFFLNTVRASGGGQ